jgi:hypothetical protein
MRKELEPDNFHDGIVHRLAIDIESKQTQLVLKEWDYPHEGIHTVSTLTFNEVAWQNFTGLSEFNCLFSVEVTDNFDEFHKYEQEYLNKMKNYFSTGTLENIQADTTLKYYWLNASHGLDGFIICKELSISTMQLVSDNN